MKRAFIIICMSVIACNLQSCKTTKDTHNSRNSLDWEGIYEGTFVTEDEKKTTTTLQLKSDNTYWLQILSEDGEKIKCVKGYFIWDDKGSQITLMDDYNNVEAMYRVEENKLEKEGEKARKIEDSAIQLQKVNENTVTEKYWRLIEINGKPVTMENSSRREAHLILKKGDNRIIGSSGCNNFNGSYTLDENSGRISFSKMAATLMACPDMEIEREMFEIFEMVDNYTMSPDGKYLSLNKARMAPLARFEVVYFR